MSSSSSDCSPRRLPVVILLFALLFPTLITWIYFIVLAREPAPLQRGAYLMGKALQCVLPLACFCGWQRRQICLTKPKTSDLLPGLLTGAVIATAAWIGYRYWLLPGGHFVAATIALRAKLTAIKLDSRQSFLALSLFYALIHSLFEEYYWRWFVFGELRSRLPVWSAAVASGAGFAAHHVLVLAAYFEGLSALTLFFSLSVGVGGVIWALMYQQSGRLYGVWLSHLLVDAALFAIGFDLLSEQFV